MKLIHAGIRPACCLVSLVVGLAVLTVGARADDYVDRVNAPFKQIPESKRSDLVLLPLLAKMDKPPAVLKSQLRAALFGSQGVGWAESKSWAQAAPQKAVLEVLPTLTAETDYLKAFAFAQPYGIEGVPLEMISAELYTELGDPPMLAAAKHLYMPALENTGILVHVEASRLSEAGETAAAVRLMVNWLLFSRQMADRAFVDEVHWAYTSMGLAIIRIRDLVYQDFKSAHAGLDPTKIKEALDRQEPNKGILGLERLRMPLGDFIAKEQLLFRVMSTGGGTNPETFATTMAQIASQERPLRLFGAAAYWEQVRAGHAGQRESQLMLERIRDDWKKRWGLSQFDPILANKTDYALQVAGRPRFAVLRERVEKVEELAPLRQRIRVETAGTRMSLGAYAYFLQNKTVPPALSAIRPQFVKETDKDPYSTRGRDLEYFVSGRDTPKDPTGVVIPYEIRLFPPDPEPEFSLKIPIDTFVLYSVGPDDKPQRSRDATQGRENVPGDYLLWPPSLSLVRQRLIETKKLN